jgi:RNA polymerase sigma-70 factor, ECF subfamily
MTVAPWNPGPSFYPTEDRDVFAPVATRAVKSERASTPDLDLLRRMVEGDSAALGVFYDAHASTLFALVCRILNDVKEAEDVLQEVFLQIWDKAAAFDATQGRPLAWAITVARHKAIDRLRATQRRRAQLLPESEMEREAAEACSAPESSPPDAAGANEEAQWVRAALAGLPAQQRRAIELAFFDGLSQTEIAAALNEPLGTIKARIRRGMLRLRAELGERG